MSPAFRPPHQPLVPPGAIDCQSRDMTATVAADVTLDQLQTKLLEFNQWLPIDGDPSKPIGSLVEHNSTGPLRLGYGAWRDLLLGCQFTNARNELITAGGRTFKNVAGYDLTKFMVGQKGFFGKLVTLTLRLWRRPAGAIRVKYEISLDFLKQILPTPLRPQWTLIAGDYLWLGYLADEPTLRYYERRLPSQNPLEMLRVPLADDVEFRRRHWITGPGSFRVSVPPARILEYFRAVGLPGFIADPAHGIVVGATRGIVNPILIGAARRLGGSAWFDEPDQAANYFDGPAPRKEILRRLHSAFTIEERPEAQEAVES